jgi:[protein-PII] uridylyltransferase
MQAERPRPAGALPELPPLDGEDSLLRARAYLEEGRRAVDAAFDAGLAAQEVVRLRARLYDRLLGRLWDAADARFRADQGAPDARLILCAVGGYGRGELSPGSDLDLLFLYPYDAGAYVEVMSERILYHLWDLALQVGSAVRSIDHCIRLAKTDLSAYTALLDHRQLAGDTALYGEFDSRLFRAVFSKGVSTFLQMRSADDQRRRERYADTVYLLEPNLKQGEGGLRDLHQALWAARVRFRAKSLADLLHIGAISEREAALLGEAQEFLLAVREVLHRHTGRKSDRLTFDVQEPVARALGHRDTDRALAVEHFMQRYYQAARTIHQHAERILERAAVSERRRKPPTRGTPVREHFRIFDGALTVQAEDVFTRRPAALVEIFREAMVRNLPLYSFAKDLVVEAAHGMGRDLWRAHEAAPAFLEILTHADDRRGTLRQMHDLGVLGAFLPEFGRLTGKAQHTLYHVYTVDVHTITAVERLQALARGALAGEEPHMSEVMREIERPRTLYLGLLFHDVGKGTGRDHSDVGAMLAIRACRRLGLTPDEIEEVAFLVRRHLAMIHIATRRDMHDEELLRTFAQEVGDEERLRKLYVLTHVDSVTTGPQVWSEWKAMLVRELYERVLQRLRGEVEGVRTSAQAADARRSDARVLLAAHGRPQETDAFLTTMPDRYFFSVPLEAVPRHFAVARQLGPGVSFALATTHFPNRGYTELTVTCRDRPGLMSLLAGALAANRIDILGAQIFTRSTGEAVDVFYVRDRQGQAVTQPAAWRRFGEGLRALLSGEATAEAMVEKGRRPSSLEKAAPRVATKIKIDNRASSTHSVIDVYTQDRLGVLYLITRTLFELGLTIDLSKVATEGNRVVDAFYVKDLEGHKVTDPARMEEIVAKLRAALATPEAA